MTHATLLATSIARCLLLASLLGVVPVSAQALEYRHHELPTVRDYIISLEAPTQGAIEFYSTSKKRLIGGKGGDYQSGSASWRVGEAGFIGLTVEVYDDEITIEDWLEVEQISLDYMEKKYPDSSTLLKIHDSGYNSLMGQRTFYRHVSPRNLSLSGLDTEPWNFRNPMGKQVMAVFDGRVRVMLEFMDDQGVRNKASNMHPALEPSLDRTASSLEVRFEELFESFRETEHFVTGTERLSSDPTIMGSVSMDVPVDWIASDHSVYFDLDHPRRPGKFFIEINHYDPSMFSGAAPRMWLAVEGLDVDRLSRHSYEQHGKAFLEARLASAREVDSRDATDELPKNSKNDFNNYAHCMSRPGKNHTEASGGMIATTYRGKDEKGREVIALHYSGGGSNVACNYLLMVAPERFPETKAQFETMLSSISMFLVGPWLEPNP